MKNPAIFEGFFLAFLFIITNCCAASLNLWDQGLKEWQTFSCAPLRGSCLAVEITPGEFQILSAYIGSRKRLAIHISSIGHLYQGNITVLVKAGGIPFLHNNDFKLNGLDPGFSQFTCYGVMLYWRIQLDTLVRKKVNVGISLNEDECISKNYEEQCPMSWQALPSDRCQPPKEYSGPCGSQNYFGKHSIETGFSNPSSWEYKMLWSERCGADWPCEVHVSSKCIPFLYYYYRRSWQKLFCKEKDLGQKNFCHSKLGPSGDDSSVQLYFLDIPPESSVLISVVPSLKNLLSEFKA